MSEHLSDFNKNLVNLQNFDVVIEDEDRALSLLSSLPDTYEHLTTILYCMGKTKLNLMMCLMH